MKQTPTGNYPDKFLIGSVLALVLYSTGYAEQKSDTESSPAASPQLSEPATARNTGASPISEKETAFKLFYKRDPACDSFKDDNMMDRCRHAYTTAKQEFEKMWAARKTNSDINKD